MNCRIPRARALRRNSFSTADAVPLSRLGFLHVDCGWGRRDLLRLLGPRHASLNSRTVRHIPAEFLTEIRFVVGVDLRIVAGSRNGHIRHPAVDEIRVGLLAVHVNQHAVSGLSLAAVAGDGVAVIEMGMVLGAEVNGAV